MSLRRRHGLLLARPLLLTSGVSSILIRRRRRRRNRRSPTMNPNLDSMVAQFYAAGVHYSAAIQPYAIKLFLGLFLIDLLTTWIQFMAEGQLDPTHFVGRLFRHVFAGGFVYLMIVNGFAWMYMVIQSFSRMGSAISGLPGLSPQTVAQ